MYRLTRTVTEGGHPTSNTSSSSAAASTTTTSPNDTTSHRQGNHPTRSETQGGLQTQLQAMCSQMPKEKLIALRRLLLRGDSADIIVQSAKETITKKDLRRRLVRKLRGKDVESEHYLSDRIMNAFFNQTAIKGIEQGHTVLCLQSTDLPDIIQRPREKWDQLLRKRLKNTDLQTVDKILIPANIRNKHWVLVVVDTRAHTLALYNSLPKFLKTHTNDNPLQPIKNFLQSHPNFKNIHWTTKDTHWFPKQQNGVDCGLYTCAAALCTIARQ